MEDGSNPIPRKSISRSLRYQILRRDNFACRYCGEQAPNVTLTVDHVVPVALGGGDEPNNLVTACHQCNSGKAATPADAAIVEDVDATAMLFAKAAERVAEKRRAEMRNADDALGTLYDHWCELYKWVDHTYLPPAWESSLRMFMARGLNVDDLQRLMYAPLERNIGRTQAFRYFAGACWREIGDREELARQMLERGEV